MDKSLFGHLAFRFVSQTENLATESLNYILNSSKTANESFRNLIKIYNNLQIIGPVFFKTQVNDEDKAFADLVCFDKDYTPVCIIESKFWAGLTENQPVAYLKRLKNGTPGLLLFICPVKRISTLWRELLIRCKDSSLMPTEIPTQSHIRCAKINDVHSIGIISWIDLLSFLDRELSISGETRTISDLQQLKGLCARMEQDAFIPLTSFELSPSIAKRNMDFPDLVEELLNLGIEKGTMTKKTEKGSLMPTTGRYRYGRYCQIGKYACAIVFDNKKWYELSNNPLWLEIYGRHWNSEKERLWAQKALEKLELENPPGVFNILGEPSSVPLKIEFGLEKDQVLDSLYNQMIEITKILDESNDP